MLFLLQFLKLLLIVWLPVSVSVIYNFLKILIHFSALPTYFIKQSKKYEFLNREVSVAALWTLFVFHVMAHIKLVLCFLLGNSHASEFYMPTFRNPLSHLHTPFEDGRECSETSAYKLQTPVNYQEESIQHSEQGESLKSR